MAGWRSSGGHDKMVVSYGWVALDIGQPDIAHLLLAKSTYVMSMSSGFLLSQDAGHSGAEQLSCSAQFVPVRLKATTCAFCLGCGTSRVGKGIILRDPGTPRHCSIEAFGFTSAA